MLRTSEHEVPETVDVVNIAVTEAAAFRQNCRGAMQRTLFWIAIFVFYHFSTRKHRTTRDIPNAA